MNLNYQTIVIGGTTTLTTYALYFYLLYFTNFDGSRTLGQLTKSKRKFILWLFPALVAAGTISAGCWDLAKDSSPDELNLQYFFAASWVPLTLLASIWNEQSPWSSLIQFSLGWFPVVFTAVFNDLIMWPSASVVRPWWIYGLVHHVVLDGAIWAYGWWYELHSRR